MQKLNGFFVLLCLLLCASCGSGDSLNYFKLSGFAQGTSYHITYGAKDSINYQESIDSLLQDFDLSLSTYVENSLISKVNRNEDSIADEKFLEVIKTARKIYESSDGAFDLTVMPLVNAWGFGPGERTNIEQEVIDSILTYVGMHRIRLEGSRIIKDNPGISFDVNAIAQGYSVDLLAEFLQSRGVENYMVEVGGEVRTLGKNEKNQVWKIGIDRPAYGNNIPGANLQAIIELEDKSLATSGNYRKFYEEDGIKYSHTIDPKSGYPVLDKILSVTIISNRCIEADAHATACMVMGLEKAKNYIKEQSLKAYVIFGDAEGQYNVWISEGFNRYLFKEIADNPN